MMRTPSTLAMRALRRSRRGLAFMPTEMAESGVIAISEPFKPAVPRDARAVLAEHAVRAPLTPSILDLEPSAAPHRIISYETKAGEQFNCAYV